MIMRLAPIAAFGAMAFTVGQYGLGSIVSLGKLMATMYLTCILFVVIVLAGFVGKAIPPRAGGQPYVKER